MVIRIVLFVLTYVQLGSSGIFNQANWDLHLRPDFIKAEHSYKNQSRVRRVVGGEESNSVYPFMGGLLQSTDQVKCGVTIIDQYHVITAAHCVRSRNPGEYRVLVGTHNLNSWSKLAIVLPVLRVAVHPGYRGGVQDDIAVLRLARPLDFSTGRVKPVALHPNVPPASSRVKFLGWGSTSSQLLRNSLILKKGESSVITYADCNGRLRGLMKESLDGKQFCIVHKSAVPCKGDSGGPVVLEDLNKGTYLLVGLISTGPQGCRHDIPSICTSISAYIPWIKNI